MRNSEMTGINTVFVAECLKLAGGAAGTGQALHLVIGENQLKVNLARRPDSG